MAWKEVHLPNDHRCEPRPDVGLYLIGDVIECDGCGARFRAVSLTDGSGSWRTWQREEK